jgi:hypothetical protein
MNLQLYGLDESRDAIPWDEFIAGFAPCRPVAEPGKEGTHWVLEHPSGDIRLYAPVAGGKITSAFFEYDDVVTLAGHPDRGRHPLWTGLFRALGTRRVLLLAELLNMGKAIIVGDASGLDRLPSWADDVTLRFVTPTRADFDRLIAEGWALTAEFNAGMQPRNGWADEHEQDEAALAAFTSYVTGKRGKTVTYRWGDKPVKPHGSSGTFLDRYGTWVDWRDFDDSIVRYFADRLKNRRLSAELQEEDLVITFGSSLRTLTIDEIGKERYQTVRAVNEVVAPDFEIRLVRKSVDGDTHCFLFAPAWLWSRLEAGDRDKLERKIKPIDAGDGFTG